MNKAGKTSPWMIAGFLILVAVLGVIAYGVTQTQLGIEDSETRPSACGVDTTLSLSVVDALSRGTSVSPTINAKINGGATQLITSDNNFAPGDTLDILLNASNYLDKTLPAITLECGVNSQSTEMYATDDSTFRIFSTNNQLLTDDIVGGDTNQTNSASPINLLMYVDSNVDESSGDMIIVVEASNTTEVDDIVLSGAGVTTATVPEFYSVAGGNSITKAFRVTALTDGESKSYTLALSPETGITMGSTLGVYVTAYTEQAFIDTDGSYATGVEDSDGTAKYEDDFDFDFLIE